MRIEFDGMSGAGCQRLQVAGYTGDFQTSSQPGLCTLGISFAKFASKFLNINGATQYYCLRTNQAPLQLATCNLLPNQRRVFTTFHTFSATTRCPSAVG